MSSKVKPHGARYPWDEWLKPGSRDVVIVRGEDYRGRSHGMASTIRQAARKRGLSVSLVVGQGRITIKTHNPNRSR